MIIKRKVRRIDYCFIWRPHAQFFDEKDDENCFCLTKEDVLGEDSEEHYIQFEIWWNNGNIRDWHIPFSMLKHFSCSDRYFTELVFEISSIDTTWSRISNTEKICDQNEK